MHDAAMVIETDIPARLDRLPWTRFHTLVVVALGITWVLDGLEVTIAGSIAGALQESPVLHLTATDVGTRRQRLSGRRGFGSAAVRLSDRPVRSPQIGHLQKPSGFGRFVIRSTEFATGVANAGSGWVF